jgi:hypothetical protein
MFPPTRLRTRPIVPSVPVSPKPQFSSCNANPRVTLSFACGDSRISLSSTIIGPRHDFEGEGKAQCETGKRGVEGSVEVGVERPGVPGFFGHDSQPRRGEG